MEGPACNPTDKPAGKPSSSPDSACFPFSLSPHFTPLLQVVFTAFLASANFMLEHLPCIVARQPRATQPHDAPRPPDLGLPPPSSPSPTGVLFGCRVQAPAPPLAHTPGRHPPAAIRPGSGIRQLGAVPTAPETAEIIQASQSQPVPPWGDREKGS